MSNEKISWAQYISEMTRHGSTLKYIEGCVCYFIWFEVGNKCIEFHILKTNPRSENQIDFEDNYK